MRLTAYPVSYTHLDVYKRQGTSRAAAPARAPAATCRRSRAARCARWRNSPAFRRYPRLQAAPLPRRASSPAAGCAEAGAGCPRLCGSGFPAACGHKPRNKMCIRDSDNANASSTPVCGFLNKSCTKSIVIGIVFDKIFFYTSNRLVLLPISQFSRDKQLRNSPPLPFNIQPLPMRAPCPSPTICKSIKMPSR